MKTLRAIGVGIIFLTLTLVTQAETEGKALPSLIDEQFIELKKLDAEGAILAKDKAVVDKKIIAYAHDHEEWYEANKVFQKYVHYIKAVIADFNTHCKTAPAPSPTCEQEKKILDDYDLPKAQEFYRKLADAKHELALQKEEILGKLGTDDTLGTIGLMGKNNQAGLAYLEKRNIIVERILLLQKKMKEVERDYVSQALPKPAWAL